MDNKYNIFLAVFFVAAFLFSLVINSLLLKFVRSMGIRNQDEATIRWSSTSKPALGGISFFIIFLFSLIVYPFEKNESGYFLHPQSLGMFAAGTLGFLLGLFDDAYNTKPWLKFFTQVACGIILIMAGISVNIFETEFLNYIITVFWVVGIMNAMNLLDNMDGITSIVSICILSAIFAILLFSGGLDHRMTFLIIGVIAALVGFLFFNWHPSKMYMGDTGSMFIGVFLAGMGIIFLWNGSNYQGIENVWIQTTGVLMAFAIPIIDTTTVFIKRIMKGSSPFIGGKDHTTHHIGYLGLKDDKVALIFILLTIIFSFLAFAVYNYVSVSKLNLLFLFWGFFLLVFIAIFIIANKNKHLN